MVIKRRPCSLCSGTGELKDAKQAWDEPDSPAVWCERCKGEGIRPPLWLAVPAWLHCLILALFVLIGYLVSR